MRVSLLVAAAAVLGSTTMAQPTGALAAAEPPQRYIVVLQDTVSDPGAVAREHAAATGAVPDHVYAHALRGYSAVVPPARVAQLRRDPRVAAVVPDAIGHLDGRRLAQPAEILPTGVDRIGDAPAGPTPTTTAPGVDVDIAIIDTGVDGAHPDLDVRGGYWCGNNSASGYDKDGHGHGTHVAGTAAARDNTIGVVGVAPGARLWALKIPDRKGVYRMSSYVCAVDWITGKRDAGGSPTIEAVNISMGIRQGMAHFPGEAVDDCGVTNSDPLHQAICASRKEGVTYAVSAGNAQKDAQTQVPAGYQEVITVSALADFDGLTGGAAGAQTTTTACRADVDDTAADFSNYGSDVDVIAPGVCITSTTSGGGYGKMSGTSMSAPHVTGAVALLAAAHPDAGPDELQQMLTSAGTYDYTWSTTGIDPDTLQEPLLHLGATPAG